MQFAIFITSQYDINEPMRKKIGKCRRKERTNKKYSTFGVKYVQVKGF